MPTPYYDHGGITIYHGDCRDILPSLAAEVLVTDPPYGLDYSSNMPGKFNGQGVAGDESTETRDAILSLWGGRPAAVFGTWKVRKWGEPRGVLVWDKGPASGMGDLSFPWKASWEDIAIYGKGWSGHRDEGVLRGQAVTTWSGERGFRRHPNEKPVWLLSHILKKAPEGAVVDPFLGSGSTLMAAKFLGRRALGIEVEEEYCEAAANRMAQGVLLLD
jgi:site-specific DNA-methyltransferase (adenine-specific)